MSEDFDSRMSDFTNDFAVAGTRKELGTGALVGARMGFRGAIARLYVGFSSGHLGAEHRSSFSWVTASQQVSVTSLVFVGGGLLHRRDVEICGWPVNMCRVRATPSFKPTERPLALH